MPRQYRPPVHDPLWIITALVLAAVAFVFALPPVPQDPAYHEFADRQGIFGIPNFWNLISNLPFLGVGAAGLLTLGRAGGTRLDPALTVPYRVFFLGIALTAFGSMYYHYAPTDASLAWDRLAMSISFMALSSAVIGEATRPGLGRALLAPLLALGTASVAYWYWTETRSAGDLRFYALVQFLPLALLPLVLVLCRDRLPARRYLWVAAGAYGLSKLFEAGDLFLLQLSGWISGHSIKHLLAALAAWLIYLSLDDKERMAHQAPGRAIPRPAPPPRTLD